MNYGIRLQFRHDPQNGFAFIVLIWQPIFLSSILCRNALRPSSKKKILPKSLRSDYPPGARMISKGQRMAPWGQMGSQSVQ
jgi:hypothetical protein